MRITEHKHWNKSAWDAINTLKGGLSKTKPSSSKQMKRPDGSLCRTPKENSEDLRLLSNTL